MMRLGRSIHKGAHYTLLGFALTLFLARSVVAQPKPTTAPAAATAASAASAASTNATTANTSTAMPTMGTAAAPTTSAPPRLTLDQVVASTKKHYPLVKVAIRDQSIAEANLRAAKGGFDPILKAQGTWEATGAYPNLRMSAQLDQPTPIWGASLFAGYRYGRGTFADYDGKLNTNEFGEFRGGARVPIWRDGPIDRRRATLAREEAGIEVAKAGRDLSEIEAIRNASLRYWDWVAANLRFDAMKRWLRLAEDRNGQLEKRVAAGEIPDLERQENLRTILQREAAVAVAQRDRRTLGFELSLFFRDDKGGTLVPTDDLAPTELPRRDTRLSAVDGERRALMNRPELARFKALAERARIEAQFARNQTKPGIDVAGAVSQDVGAQPDEISTKRGKPVFEASIFLDVPLLNRAPLGRAKAAEEEALKVDDQVVLQKDRILADVRSASVAIDTAIERAQLAEKEFAVAIKLAEAEVTKFNLGDSSLLTVNIREQARAEAEVRLIDAAVDVEKAWAGARAAMGEK
jgi:outer membrane protein, heavy metal efflux system